MAIADKTKCRPDNWEHLRSKYLEQNQPSPPHYKTRQRDYEAGADAMYQRLRAEIMMKLIQYEWGMTGHDVLVWLREFFKEK